MMKGPRSVRDKFGQHSDIVLLITVILLFVASGAWIFYRWGFTPDDWQTDFETYSVDPARLTSTGMGRDDITAINQPRWVSIETASAWLDARSPVIAIIQPDLARAYPLIVMLRHEIVNDQLGDLAIAVTFCPICNSAIVYNRTINGSVLQMGVTGAVYNNNFVMYDHMTESYWLQLTGEAIMGEYTGTLMEMIPAQVVGFQNFANSYPDGVVLAGDLTMPNETYHMSPYVGYDSNESPMFSNVTNLDRRLMPMERVLASVVDDRPVAYSFELLQQQGVINDTLNDEPIVVFWLPGAASVLDGATTRASRDVGQAALFGRQLGDQVLTFHYDNGQIIDDQTGSSWSIFGEAYAGALTGQALPKYSCYSHFWFAWSAAYPETQLITTNP